MSKAKKTHEFKVTLKMPATQRQADAIQKKPGYSGYMESRPLFGSHAGPVKSFTFFFEGPEKKIRSTHARLKRLKSKNIRVYAVKKVPK